MTKKRVLIVEDVDSMRELLAHVIGEMGSFALSGTAANGAEARFELTRRYPDLVLLDEVLPGESSADLLEELAQLEIPVVLITSMEERTGPLPPGARARLYKPTWKAVAQDRERMERELLKALGA